MKNFISTIAWAAWSTSVAMVGFHIHHSAFWAVVDFFFSIITPIKWLVCHELTLSIIRDTFAFFLN